MSQPASIFSCDPRYLALIASYTQQLQDLAADAKDKLVAEDWKHLCDRANALFKK